MVASRVHVFAFVHQWPSLGRDGEGITRGQWFDVLLPDQLSMEPTPSNTVAKMRPEFPGIPESCRLFDSGEYSDLKLVCQTREFKVHKVIVCTQYPVPRATPGRTLASHFLEMWFFMFLFMCQIQSCCFTVGNTRSMALFRAFE